MVEAKASAKGREGMKLKQEIVQHLSFYLPKNGPTSRCFTVVTFENAAEFALATNDAFRLRDEVRV